VCPTEYTEWQRPLSGVHSFIMEKLAQSGEGGGYTLGGFNVSNLMGIKRRMINIGKKITFTFCKMFENVQFFRICI
jgi:hypothetical protein